MFSPTDDQLTPRKHHIDVSTETVKLLKMLKKHGDTYDNVIRYLMKQTANHQKCLKSKANKHGKE